MSNMKILTNWTAKRAGGRITITGRLNDQPYKIVGVDTIECGNVETEAPVAIDKNGERYLLA